MKRFFCFLLSLVLLISCGDDVSVIRHGDTVRVTEKTIAAISEDSFSEMIKCCTRHDERALEIMESFGQITILPQETKGVVTDMGIGKVKIRLNDNREFWCAVEFVNKVIANNEVVSDVAKYEVDKDYQILYHKNIGDVTTYYVLLLWDNFNEEELKDLADFIKEKESPNGVCNIHIYDTKDIVPLIEKYPLKGKEYVDVAEHLVLTRTFDGMTLYYPMIDWYYKECGGKKTK